LVNAVLVIGAITRERGHRSFHLIQQAADPRGVIDVIRRQCGGDGTVKLSGLRLCSSSGVRYAGYRYPPELIGYAVWLYFRFPLSLRMVE
jgi:hypothetical protein